MKYSGQEVAESIDNYCEVRHVSKQEFFEGAQITSGSLSQWRNGKHDPSMKNIRTIEQFVGMKMDEILIAFKKRPTTITGDGQDAELDEIMELARVAPPAARKFLLAGLRAAVEQAAEAQDGLSK